MSVATEIKLYLICWRKVAVRSQIQIYICHVLTCNIKHEYFLSHRVALQSLLTAGSVANNQSWAFGVAVLQCSSKSYLLVNFTLKITHFWAKPFTITYHQWNSLGKTFLLIEYLFYTNLKLPQVSSSANNPSAWRADRSFLYIKAPRCKQLLKWLS